MSASQPPMLAKASFFALIVMPSAISEHVAHDVDDRAAALPAWLAFLDEPGVLGKAASVDDEGLAEAVRQRRRGADVLRG